VLEHGRAVSCQMFIEPDGSPLGLADQLGEPPLALDQRQVAQVVNPTWDYGRQDKSIASSLGDLSQMFGMRSQVAPNVP
jgi:hypothetical protein